MQHEIVPHSVAATSDDIAAAVKAGKLMASPEVRGAISTLLNMEHLEQFNFGKLSIDTLQEVQQEAMEFVEYGCFELPYPECAFRVTIDFDNRPVGFHIFAVSNDATGNVLQNNSRKIAVLCTISFDGGMVTFRSDNALRTIETSKGRAVEVLIPAQELKFWEPKIGKIVDRDAPPGSPGWVIGSGPEHQSAQNILEGSLILMGLVMILNTKGVLKERSEPPSKRNKQRAAAGRPLLPYTTRVYTSVYNEAVKEGPVGTHASPRPHRRRAHVRRYPKTDHHEAYSLPIAAMLVNWDGAPLSERPSYTVK